MGTKPTVLHLMVRCSTPKLNLLLLIYSIVMVSVNVNDQFDNILGSLEVPKEICEGVSRMGSLEWEDPGQHHSRDYGCGFLD